MTTASMVQVGTLAERPSAGSLYFVTDDGQQRLTYWNATAWVDVAPGLTSSGAIAATQMPALTGDVTTNGGGVATAIGATKVTNAMLVGAIDLATKVTGVLPATSHPALTGDVTTSSGGVATTIGAAKVTNAMLAGSIDLTAKVTNQLPFANGGNAGSAATSATTGTMTVNMTTAIVTITPTGACTFNASGGVTGQLVTFVITTSGVSSFVLTFGTNFISQGTLATGTTTGKKFSVTFRCVNGTSWQEIGRTAAM